MKLLNIFFILFYFLFLEIKGNESKVKCITSKGDIYIHIYHNWAPIGAKRFLDLVKDNFFTGF